MEARWHLCCHQLFSALLFWDRVSYWIWNFQLAWLADYWNPEILSFPSPCIGIVFQFTPHTRLPYSSLLILVPPVKFDSSAFRGLFPFIFKIHLFLFSPVCVCLYSTCILGTLRSHKRMSDSLKLEPSSGSWESNLHLLKEEQLLLTTESSLQVRIWDFITLNNWHSLPVLVLCCCYKNSPQT